MARYFLSRLSPVDSNQGNGSYWRGAQSYTGWSDPGDTYESVFTAGKPASRGIQYQINLNLLAYARGDTLPDPDSGHTHVDPLPYQVRHADPDPIGDSPANFSINLQPFVQADDASGRDATAFPIGSGLRKFLDDPLQIGGSLGLALPFCDRRVSLSKAWMRDHEDPGSVVHGGFDFSTPLNPRPLHDAYPTADGEVVLLLNAEQDSGHQGGVLLSHRIDGKRFFTLYQHLQPRTVSLAVGDRVSVGTKLGTIRRWNEISERSHNHFNLLVSSPRFMLGTTSIPALWYAIDPFGVYDYHESNYIPQTVDGIEKPIQGAERTIHWAGNPPIEALPIELTTDFLPIRQIQARVRDRNSVATSSPVEHDQVLVWLEGIDEFHFVALGQSLNRAIESELIQTIRRSYASGKRVRLGYRMHNGRRKITAVWARN
jgi:murein DD-endopeptidase MepM/ murein hydrolase activator NlpD